MWSQSIPLAAAGAVYPIGFAAITVILSGSDPMHRALAFLAGGAAISLVGYSVLIVVLRSSQLTPRHHPTVSAVIKVVLGAVLLALALASVLRRRGSAEPAPGEREIAAEAEVSSTSSKRSFYTGAMVYFPGVFLIASAKVIADARAGFLSTAVASIVCIAVLLAMAEVPVAAFAVAPTRVVPLLEGLRRFAINRLKPYVPVVAALGGGYLVVSGVAAI